MDKLLGTGVSTLVNHTQIQHPEEPKEPSTPNAWRKPPRMRRTTTSHSYDVVPNNVTPKKKTNNNTVTYEEITNNQIPRKTPKQNDSTISVNSKPDENVNGQALLNELKNMKAEIIGQCSKMFNTEANKLREAQEEQQRLIKENETKQKQDHKLVMELIQQLTTTLDIIRESIAKHNESQQHTPTHKVSPSQPEDPGNIITQMEVDPKSHKRKEASSNPTTSHRKQRASNHE